MLQIKSISKRYKTGDFVQQALDKVSLNPVSYTHLTLPTT